MLARDAMRILDLTKDFGFANHQTVKRCGHRKHVAKRIPACADIKFGCQLIAINISPKRHQIDQAFTPAFGLGRQKMDFGAVTGRNDNRLPQSGLFDRRQKLRQSGFFDEQTVSGILA